MMQSRTFKNARRVWIAVCVLLLLFILHELSDPENKDTQFVLGYGMLVLTFPSFFLVAYLLTFIYASGFVLSASAASAPPTRLEFFLTWLGFFAIGYFQWFVCIPYLLKTIENLAASRRNRSDNG